MAYDPPPWKEGPEVAPVDRVRNIVEYITSKDSSWPRTEGINMIWNGAKEEDHNKAEPEEGGNGGVTCKRDGSGDCPIPLPNCNGLAKDGKNTYASGDQISKLINDDFCPMFNDAFQGSEMGKKFNEGTPDEVFIDFKADSTLSKEQLPNSDICSKHLHNIIDNCDKDMQINWKGGGDFHIGQWYWNIYPTHDRPAADSLKTPQAWCTIHKDYSVDMWGAGWENSDFGEGLKKGLTDYSVGDWKQVFSDMGKWSFNYELIDGKHEWRAYVGSQPEWLLWDSMGQDKGGLLDRLKFDVQEVMKSVARYDGFSVDCAIDQ